MAAQTAEYDAIIVGARVTGSLLATLLGEGGHRILLLDRAKFPSDTLSTHFFRAPALRAFQAAGVLDQVLAVAPHLTVNYNAIDGIVFPEPLDGPEDFPFYLCVRRITLDEILVRRAKTFPSVEMKEGAVAQELLRENGRVSGVVWKDDDGQHRATGRVVVGADGLHSFVAKEVGAKAEREEPINRAMYYAYYKDLPPNEGPAAEFHFNGNYLVYVFPCDGNLTLVAATVPIADFAEFKRDPEAHLEKELQKMVALKDRLKKAARDGPVRGTGSIPGRLRIPYGDGWALAGDAGMVIDPWSGQGIDQGSTGATYLARELDEYLAGRKEWGEAMQSYHKERNAFSLKTYENTCKYSRDLRPMTRAALARRGLLT